MRIFGGAVKAGRRIGSGNSPAIRPTPLPEGAKRAVRAARQANGLAELHQSLVEITGPAAGEQALQLIIHRAAQWRSCGTAAESKQSSDHARRVAVHNGIGLAKGDAEDGARGVIADAGKGPNAGVVARKLSGEFAGNHPRGSMKIERAPIIAEAGPGFEDLLAPGARQMVNGGKRPQKIAIKGENGGHLGLLKHDFGYPDGVRIARLSPGKGASYPPEPAEKCAVEASALFRLRRLQLEAHPDQSSWKSVWRIGEAFPCESRARISSRYSPAGRVLIGTWINTGMTGLPSVANSSTRMVFEENTD